MCTSLYLNSAYIRVDNWNEQISNTKDLEVCPLISRFFFLFHFDCHLAGCFTNVSKMVAVSLTCWLHYGESAVKLLLQSGCILFYSPSKKAPEACFRKDQQRDFTCFLIAGKQCYLNRHSSPPFKSIAKCVINRNLKFYNVKSHIRHIKAKTCESTLKYLLVFFVLFFFITLVSFSFVSEDRLQH